MFTVLLVVHVLVTLALIGSVLIQRSEGGGLGIGGAQGMGSFMTGRGTANLLTRTTAVLATIFLALSLILALMSRGNSGGANAIFGAAPPPAVTAPAIPATPAKPAVPAAPSTP
jgi:preprotein translocase subunit SecG